MILKNYTFTLDTTLISSVPNMVFTNTDIESVGMTILFTNNNEVFDLNGYRVGCTIQTPLGNKATQLVNIVDVNKVEVVLREQNLTNKGKYLVELFIMNGETLVSLHKFDYLVTNSLVNNGTEITLENDYLVLNQLIGEIEGTKVSLSDLAAQLNTDELSRKDAESIRVANEQDRLANLMEMTLVKDSMISQETQRQSNELARETKFGEIENKHTEMKTYFDTTKPVLDSLKVDLVNLDSQLSTNESTRQTTFSGIVTDIANKKTELDTKHTNFTNEINDKFGVEKEGIDSLKQTLLIEDQKRNDQEVIRQSNELIRIANNEQISRNDVYRQNQVNDKIAEIDETLRLKVVEIDETFDEKVTEVESSIYSIQTQVDTKLAEVDTTIGGKVGEVNTKIIEMDATKTDINNRFNLLTSQQQQASEVINMRTSTTKAKTFVSSGERVEELEKDVLTSQSTQVTDNISYINTLANGLDGSTDISIKGNTLVNLYPDNIEKVLPIPLSLVDRVDSVIHLGNTLEGNSEFNLKGQSFVNLLGNSGDCENALDFDKANSSMSVDNTDKVFGNACGKFIASSNGVEYGYTKLLTVDPTKYYFLSAYTKKGATHNGTQGIIKIATPSYANLGLNNYTPSTSWARNGLKISPTGLAGNSSIRVLVTTASTNSLQGDIFLVDGVQLIEISVAESNLSNEELMQKYPFANNIGSVENTTIRSIGENLFDLNQNNYTLGKAQASYNLETNRLTVKTTSTSWSYVRKIIKLKPSTQYTIQAKRTLITGTDSYCGNIGIKNKEQTVTFVDYNMAKTSATFTTDITGETSFCFFASGLTSEIAEVIFEEVTLVQGTTPKTYSAYRSTSITVTDTLRSVGSVVDEYIGNKKINRVGRVVLNGTESGWMLMDNSLTNTLMFRIPSFNGLTMAKACLSDKFVSKNIYSLDEEGIYIGGGGNFYFRILRTKATDLATFKTWLSTNNIEVLYELEIPIETTITPLTLPTYLNGTLVVEPTKLFPKLSSQDTYDRTINLKPSTLYSIFVNAKTVGTLEVDLGGTKGNITPISTYTNNKVTITTPSTLTHSQLRLKGGNISTKDYMIIETDVVEPKYFSGISSVETDVVFKSIGENLFDGVLEYGSLGADGKTTITTNAIRSKNFINVKPSTYYSYSNSLNYQLNIIEYDANYSVVKTYAFTSGTVSTLPNTKYIKFRTSEGSVQNNLSCTVMINLGTTPKAYTPYKEDKLTLSEYLLPEHFPLRSVGSVSDEYVGKKLYRRLDKMVLNGSESGWNIAGTQTTNTFSAYIDITGSKALADTPILTDKFPLILLNSYATYDSEAIFSVTPTGVNGRVVVRISKKKATDLATFKTWLASNNLTVIYQLATPQEINLDRPLNIQVYKNGSIVTEPTKLLPKLTYTFPTNINSGLVGIQKSLQNIKDNQNFIMAYMLDLETRLSLIEGGM